MNPTDLTPGSTADVLDRFNLGDGRVVAGRGHLKGKLA